MHARRHLGPSHGAYEIVLWCLLILPGLIYSLWRVTTRSDVCRACGSSELVPATSPVGKKLLVEHGLEPPRNAAVGVGRALAEPFVG